MNNVIKRIRAIIGASNSTLSSICQGIGMVAISLLSLKGVECLCGADFFSGFVGMMVSLLISLALITSFVGTGIVVYAIEDRLGLCVEMEKREPKYDLLAGAIILSIDCILAFLALKYEIVSFVKYPGLGKALFSATGIVASGVMSALDIIGLAHVTTAIATVVCSWFTERWH